MYIVNIWCLMSLPYLHVWSCMVLTIAHTTNHTPDYCAGVAAPKPKVYITPALFAGLRSMRVEVKHTADLTTSPCWVHCFDQETGAGCFEQQTGAGCV